MSKINLDDTVTNNSSTTLPYNENFRLIEAEFQDKVLYRTNPTGEPNQMNNDLDMNSNRVYNLPLPILDNEAARLKDVKEAISGATSANLMSLNPYGCIASTNVQGALQEL